MNLIDAMKAAFAAEDSFSLSSSEKELLVFGLIRIWNDRGRPDTFAAKETAILGATGMSRTGFKRARKGLSDKSIIDWSSGERNVSAASYSILKLFDSWTNTDHEPGHEPGHEPDPYIVRGEESREKNKNTPKSPTKKKQPTEWKPDETQQRINRLFRRKDSTRWKADELAAYRQNEYTEEDLAEIERYYSADIPGDDDYRRRDILRLLRHWPGEVDRARCWKPKPKYKPGHMLDIPDDYGPPGVSYGL